MPPSKEMKNIEIQQFLTGFKNEKISNNYFSFYRLLSLGLPFNMASEKSI